MKTIFLKQAGGVENLYLGETETPTLKANEVLVETKAIALNPADVKSKENDQMLSMMFGTERPVILGWDIAGEVAEVGENVTKFQKGDRVFWMVNFPGVAKAYAEFVASPEEHLAKIPENTSFEQAAGATLAALTALQLLKGKIKKGDTILVQGGAGGVGHYAIQIAKNMGAYVYTTASEKNTEFVKSIGADEVIDYRKEDFSEKLSDLDVVFDVFWGEMMEKNIKILRNWGKYLSTVMPGAIETEEWQEWPQPPVSADVIALIKEKNIEANPFLVVSNGEDENMLAEMLASGTLKTHICDTFAFENMADAHTRMTEGGIVGKVIVTV